MDKKVVVAIVSIYLIMMGLNFLTPLYYGDDYVYAFIWPNQFMNIPLPETVERVSSVTDLLVSQWRHYFTGNGRTIAHLFVQFFVWQGKWLFNLVNPLVFVLLILEIQWIANEGNITFKNLRISNICWIFFILWIFVPDFFGIYLWLAGACNYLWSIAILLFFLLPYVHKYFENSFVKNNISKPINVTKASQIYLKNFMFFCLGICAGWSNENTICWIILFLAFWLYNLYKAKQAEGWMIYGLIGLCIGYFLLIFAPGNTVRVNYYMQHYFMNNWFTIFSMEFLKGRLLSFGIIEFLQIPLWYFIFCSLWKANNIDQPANEYCTLARWCCTLSLLVNLVMLLTPDFPLRSGFASLVFVVIAASLVSHRNNTRDRCVANSLKKHVRFLSSTIFIVTTIGTFLGWYQIYEYDSYVKKMIQYHKQLNRKTILEIPEYRFNYDLNLVNGLSAGHLLFVTFLSEEENDWRNVAVARFYGIKGVRSTKK